MNYKLTGTLQNFMALNHVINYLIQFYFILNSMNMASLIQSTSLLKLEVVKSYEQDLQSHLYHKAWFFWVFRMGNEDPWDPLNDLRPEKRFLEIKVFFLLIEI